MKVMEKLKSFWTVTLGPDYPEEISDNFDFDSIDKEQQSRIEDIEQQYTRHKSKSKDIVEKVVTSAEAVKQNKKEKSYTKEEKDSIEKDIGEK